MKKMVIFLFNAFIALFGINTIAKIIEYFLIFDKLKPVESIFYMFLFSLSFRFLLIVLYDYRKIDYFKVEWLKENREIILKETNSLLAKINRLDKVSAFFNKFYYLKWVGNLFFFLSISWAEPIFMVIYYRDGYKKWNGIPNLKILAYYLFSCMLCSATLFFSLKAMGGMF